MGKHFSAVNTTTGGVTYYGDVASIARAFRIHKDWVFMCLTSECLLLHLDGESYHVRQHNLREIH
jgi:hypothetical protein